MGEVIQMSNHLHGVWGYRHWKCRCDVCSAAYQKHIMKRRKNPEPSVLIDPEPLIAFIEKEELRISGSMMQNFRRWRSRGGVDIFVADKMCIKRGAHPSQVYGEDWWHFGHEQILANA